MGGVGTRYSMTFRFDPTKIVSFDPWGHLVQQAFASEIANGLDVRPSIAVTKAVSGLAIISGACYSPCNDFSTSNCLKSTLR